MSRGVWLRRLATVAFGVTSAASAVAAARPAPPSHGVAVVTGGSRGIGASCCCKLSEAGYEVVVVYRSGAHEASEVVASIASGGGRAVAMQADVAEESDVVKLFEDVDAWRGPSPLRVLVNNAGVLGPKGAAGGLSSLTTDSLLNVLKVNTVGPALCIRESEKRMSTANGATGGAIVQISSGSAYIGSPLQYACSKGALNSLTIGLVGSLCRNGIRINTISPVRGARRAMPHKGIASKRRWPPSFPSHSVHVHVPILRVLHAQGMTATDMIAETLPSFDMSQIPLGRIGTPGEIADCVVWLCSESASYVAGANVRVAGGRPPGTTLG